MRKAPVVSVRHFHSKPSESDFYASSLRPHIRTHAITRVPHKHDFYFVAYFTQGSGFHEIDFRRYPVKPGYLFVMTPGQMHSWDLSADAEGYVIIHSSDFYEEGLLNIKMSDHSFFLPFSSTPLFRVKKTEMKLVAFIMDQLLEEYKKTKRHRETKIRTLLSLLYIELARQESATAEISQQRYLQKLHDFEKLVDAHYHEWHLPSEYASQLNISERHLNRITQTTIGKASGDLIQGRIILEAKRKLTQAGLTVTELAFELGFKDTSYFSRFFTREAGVTPSQFAQSLHR